MNKSNLRRLRTHLSFATPRKQAAKRRAIRSLLGETLESRVLLAVTAQSPAANSSNAPTSTDVSATFDQAVATANAQTFVVRSQQGGTLFDSDVAVVVDGMTVTSNPNANFFPGTTVEVTSTSAVNSPASVWRFRTAAVGSGDFVDSGQRLGNAAANTPSFGAELGDFDGDGDLDFFSANFRANQVFLNDGNGVFTDTGQALGNNFSRQAALGDMDGDGDIDVVVANDGGQSNQGASVNEIFFNDGTGVFARQTFGGGRSRDVEIGDLDGDGDLDVVVSNSEEGNRVYLNNGSGLLASGAALGDHVSQGMALGDLDGDGDLDAVFANGGEPAEPQTQPSRIWLNNGSGVFSDSGQLLANTRTKDFDIGDLDGDGDNDLYMASADYIDKVFLNNGSGVFTDTGQTIGGTGVGTGGARTEGVKLGDVDGDGDLDAFTIVNNAGNSVLWLNDGNAEFTNAGLSLDLNTNATDVVLGDIEGDGDLDAVVVNDNTFVAGASVAHIWINANLFPSVSLAVDNASIAEAAGVATVTASLSATHTQPVTIDLGTSGSATVSDDFTISSNQIVIAAGSTTGSVTITAVQDAIDEPNESVVVDITGVTNGQEAGAQQAAITIEDDDEPAPSVTLSVDAPTIAEAGGSATFTATLSAAAALPVTVDLALSGSAAFTADYTVSSMQILIAAGATSGSVTVTAVQDAADEPDESVIVEIAGVTNGLESGTQQATTTILDDDLPVMPDVSLTVDNGSIDEAGGIATFSAVLSEATTAVVTVELELSGSATAGADYTAEGTQIVIQSGATSGSITVTAIDDEEDEANETVIVSIGSVTGGSESGTQQQLTTITDDDAPPSFNVASLTTTASGFVAQLSTDVDTTNLNLYDTQNAGVGAADALLVGASSGPVAGSLLVDESLRSVTFIKTGGPLVPDSYTVTLVSGTTAFQDVSGQLLDGNGDGTGGDDYSGTFDVAEPAAGSVTLSVPDLTRGPGQEVNLPANTSDGIPVTISEGSNVRAVDLRISYNPALLSITGATVGANMPAGATVVTNFNTPGLAILVFFSSTALPAGSNTLVHLEAEAPTADASANYGSLQVLDLHAATVSDGNDNESPVVADDAYQLATYFGDVSGNGRINAADASQVARFAALIDSGFTGSLLADPIVVGDVSGNGRINASDASLVAQFAALINVPVIPPVPGGIAISGVPSLLTLAQHDAVTQRVAGEGTMAVSADDAGVDSSFHVVELFATVGSPDPQATDMVLAEAEVLTSDLEAAIDGLLE